MLCVALIALAFVAPQRLDADGTPLPAEAVRRFGSFFLGSRLHAG